MHLCLVGWPAEKLPGTMARVEFLNLVVERVNRLLEGTNRRVASNGTYEVQPKGWRPVYEGDVDPAAPYPLMIVLEYDPEYVGRGWFAYAGGGATPVCGCAIMSTHSLELKTMNDRDRQQLLHTPEHELLHLWGCAIGEMYDFRRAKDVTGTLPKLDLDAWDEEDAFWAAHRDWLRDPMVANDGDRLCEVNRWIVDGNFSGVHAPKMPTSVKIVVDVEATAGVEVELWRHNPERGESRQELVFRTPGRLPGALVSEGIYVPLVFPGESADVLSSFDLFLLKVRGNTARGEKIGIASWVSLWDFVECEEAAVHIAFTPVLPPHPSPSDIGLVVEARTLPPPVELVGAELGLSKETGKPVIRFSAINLVKGAAYVVEGSGDGLEWWETAVHFRAFAREMKLEWPVLRERRFFRLKRIV